MDLKIAAMEYSPFVESCWRTCEKAHGFFMEIVQLMCNTQKFHCIFFHYNTSDKENSWNSLIEQVRDGVYDTTIPIITATPERAAMIDFSPTIFFAQMILVFRTPTVNQWSFSNLLAMQWNVWLCLLICITIIALLLTTAECRTLGKNVLSKVIINCLNTFAIFTNQTQEMDLFHLSMRIIIAFWAVSALIVSGVYSGKLLTFLLKMKIVYPFHDFGTFVECLEREECQFATNMNPSIVISMFSNDEIEYALRINKVIHKTGIAIYPSVDGLTEDILRRKDKYLVWFATEPNFLASVEDHKECKFTYVSTNFFDRYHFPMRKNSTFKKIIDSFTLRVRSMGRHLKMYNKYGDISCVPQQNTEGKPMPVSTMFSLLFALLIGFAISLCVLCIENLCKRNKNNENLT